jgi:hypothetical protein
VTASQQFQAKGFYMSGCVSLVLAALKLTEMKSWSWWRVFLPMVVLFGILALVAQFFYWAAIVKKLNDRLVDGSGHRDID